MTWIMLGEFEGRIADAGSERQQRRALERATRDAATAEGERGLCTRCHLAPVWTPHAKLCRSCRVELQKDSRIRHDRPHAVL